MIGEIIYVHGHRRIRSARSTGVLAPPCLLHVRRRATLHAAAATPCKSVHDPLHHRQAEPMPFAVQVELEF